MKVPIGVIWQEYGTVEVDIPDEIEHNIENFIDYIKENWDRIPLPSSGTYISDSAEFDAEGFATMLELNKER